MHEDAYAHIIPRAVPDVLFRLADVLDDDMIEAIKALGQAYKSAKETGKEEAAREDFVNNPDKYRRAVLAGDDISF